MPIMGLMNTGRYKAMKDVYGAQRSIPLVRNQNGVVFEKRTVETELPVTFKTNGTSPDNYQLLGRCKVSGEKHIYLDEPLRGIGEYKDILDLSTGTVTRQIKKLVLTGEESWRKWSMAAGTTCERYYINISEAGRSLSRSLSLSSHFELATTTEDFVHFRIGGSSNDELSFYIDRTMANTAADFKSYLSSQYAAGTPVIVYYVLFESTTEQVTVPSGLTGTIEGYYTQDGTPTPDSPVEIEFNGIELVNGKYSVTVKRSQNSPATVQMVGERTGNLAPPLSEWVDGYVIGSGNGDIHSPSVTAQEKTSPFIDIKDVPRNHYLYMRHESGDFPDGGSGSVWTCIGYYDYRKAFISRPVSTGAEFLKQYTMPENAAYCRLSFRTYGETGSVSLSNGTVAFPYEPYGFKTTITQNGEEKTIYFGSEQLCDIPDTIGDYRDALDYKTQTLTRWIKSTTLDGTEAFEKVGSGDTAYFRYEIGDRGYARSLGVLCTHFKTAAVTSSTTAVAINVTNSSSTGKQYICIRPENADATSLADFLQFLSDQYSADMPVKVWYALTEPETSTVDIPKLTTTQSVSTFTVGTTLSPFETTVKTSTAVTPYTGTSEVTFCSDRTKIRYSVAGNSQQSGTPTPDPPIQPEFVGERTGNLFDKSAKNASNGYISNGFIASDGVKQANYDYRVSEYIAVSPNQSYTLRYGSNLNLPSVCFYDSSKTFISGIAYSGRLTVPFITPQNAAFLRLSLRAVDFEKVMLNSGTEPLPYEPYGFKIPLACDGTTKNVYLSEPLAKIGDYADILDRSSQTVTRRIKKLVLTGEEEWRVASGVFYLDSINQDYMRAAGEVTHMCSHFPASKQVSSAGYVEPNTFAFGSSIYSQRMYCTYNAVSKVSDFKSYLSSQYAAGTPVTVWYVLAEPTTERIEAPDFTPSVSDITTYSSTLNFKPTAKFTGQLRPVVFGFHVDPSIADPYNAVTYICDAEGLAPAKMGDTAFDYGSWKNAFFMPRPCMLNFDGTVAYYLDPDDYTKRVDGTASDIGDPTFNGNAMMEWPKIWWKFVATDTLGEGYFYVANEKLDDEFRCWSNIDANGEETDYFYTAIFNSTLHDGKFRSLSGYALTSANGSGGTTVEQEIGYCEANNSEGKHDWYTAVWSDRTLINALLVLMGKSLDTQSVFGRGLDTGDQAAKEAYVTGSLNQNGLFYGDTSAGSSAVKVFGMENWWGCCWSRTAGCVLSAGDYRVKMIYPYNTSGVGYHTLGADPEVNGVVTKMRYTPYGMKPAETTTDDTAVGYSDNYYKNASGDRYLGVGGRAGGGSACGAFSYALNFTAANASWYFSTTLSCKPESE